MKVIEKMYGPYLKAPPPSGVVEQILPASRPLMLSDEIFFVEG